MSKKKATMTLKDFHGGSIPSDLPLPSAPGVIVRPVDRGGFDRQTSWGNSTGRSDHRLRPASAGSVRNLNDKAPFLSHNSHIGRNFDEDERKPLDGVSVPRRTVGDESIRTQLTRSVGPKVDNVSDARVGSRATTFSASPVSSGTASSSHAGMLSEVHNVGLNNQNLSGGRNYGSNYPNMGGSAGQPVSGSHRNAWGIRKETLSIKEPVSAPWSALDAATKLAHASALEKISSGRWNPKQQIHTPKDAEVFEHLETEGESLYKTSTYNNKKFDRLDLVGDADYHDVTPVMHTERSLAIDDVIHSGQKEMPTYERVRSTLQVESYERTLSVNATGSQVLRSPGKSVVAEFPTLPSESIDRPKLKLLPRSKPLGSIETQVDYNQGYQQPIDRLHVEDSYVVHQPANPTQTGFTDSLIVEQAIERPKLNLRPRSQPIEQLEGNSGMKRGTVFGGARPREVVLKERGIDDPVGNYEIQSPISTQRIKEDAPKVDSSVRGPAVRYTEKAENIPGDQRITKHTDRRDQRPDTERTDSLRRNRQNEKVEKHRNQLQPQQLQDRPPSPETWRKPVEPAKPASPDAPPRYGKAASALELAQAFSKPASDPKLADRFSGHRGLPRGGQVPFSRLMGPTPRPQINGY